MLTLQGAIDQLYETAVLKRSHTSAQRLKALAEYCVHQLEVRGLPGVEIDAIIPGGGREKQWDVAWKLHGKYRLAISLKSILKNLAGTVPNRIDDLIGEVANVQMYSPEIVVGYIMIFDVSQDRISRKHGTTWYDLLYSRLRRLSGRRAPFWSVGMIEAFAVVKVDFSSGPVLLSDEEEVEEMFDILVSEVVKRNPSLGA